MRFEAVDSGIGVPREALGELFQPFHQVDGSRSRRAGGTGLGLAISQKIVEAMGGHIEIESQPGRGSSFHFTLGFDLDPHPPSGDMLDSSMTPLDALPSRLAGTVLVVEDNPVTASSPRRCSNRSVWTASRRRTASRRWTCCRGVRSTWC